MANARRITPIPLSSSSETHNTNTTFSSLLSSPPNPTSSSSFSLIRRKTHLFPLVLLFLFFIFWVLIRTPPIWFSLSNQPQEQHRPILVELSKRKSGVSDNFIAYSSATHSNFFFNDRRGWLLNPVTAARESGLSGGALDCRSVHVGEIRPGGVRGNHRHHNCSETFIIWGAKTLFRPIYGNLQVEKNHVIGKDYEEFIVAADEVAVATSPRGTAHALVNMDHKLITYFLGCQDSLLTNGSSTDFQVWKDL
ncbi:hypothetical protein AMTRI_Chr01g127830 [Amborella trichopoda]